MNSSKMNDWLQLIASATVIAGLFFVYQELRQNNQIARAERVSNIYMDWTPISQTKIENDILALQMKATEEPENLTDAEVGRLDAFFELIWNNNLHLSEMSQLGFAEFDIDLQASDLVWYLNSALGRAWMKHNSYWIVAAAPELHDAVMEKLRETPIPTKFQYMDDLRRGE